jgi:hypothetical protein
MFISLCFDYINYHLLIFSPAFPKKPAAFYPKARLLFKKAGGLLKFTQ